MVPGYNGILFSYKENRNIAIFRNADATGNHYAKWNKPEPERQATHVSFNMKSQNLKLYV